MVLQVLADVGEVHNRLDANLLQCSGVANAGELKKLWGGDRPRGEDNLEGGIYGEEWTYVKSMDEGGGRSFRTDHVPDAEVANCTPRKIWP